MNDIEKLKALSNMFEEAPTGAIVNAIKALERMMPKKPVKHIRELDLSHADQCPVCNFIVSREYKCNYCPDCGQAIDHS